MAAAALLGCGGQAAAQAAARAPVAATGHVGRLRGADTVPVAGVRVMLHEIGLVRQGPIDSAVTDGRGRFRFHFRSDSGALYLTSARHDGIEYFSQPITAAPGEPDTGIVITVADTSSAAPVAMTARNLAITRPGDDGNRNVLDLITLRNASGRTRVGGDSTRPSWSARLPAGIDSLEVGQGDFSPEAVSRRGDSVLVFAAISPGEKQLTIDYHVPARRGVLAVGFDERIETVNLLVEETDARVSGFAAAALDTQTVEGRTFRRWHGPVAAGDTVRIDFGRARADERWILVALVGLVAAALAAAAWRYRVLAAVAIVVLAGCAPSAQRAAIISVVDDAGDTTTLAAPARRIVSLIPATTELLFAIGAGDAVVGRTKWCDYPAAAAKVADVGDGVSPNIEAVLARRPDLVIFYRSVQHTAVVDRLRSLGVPAIQLNTDALRDVPRVAWMLGRLTGHQRAADSLGRAFEAALGAATAWRPERRPSVLLLVWEQPPMTVGTGSYLSELVEHAGGINLFADISASSAAVSLEAVTARDPDVVLLTAEGPTAFASRPEWQAVRAVRRRRFIRVGGSAFGHPGPRSPAAIAELARRLHELGP